MALVVTGLLCLRKQVSLSLSHSLTHTHTLTGKQTYLTKWEFKSMSSTQEMNIFFFLFVVLRKRIDPWIYYSLGTGKFFFYIYIWSFFFNFYIYLMKVFVSYAASFFNFSQLDSSTRTREPVFHFFFLSHFLLKFLQIPVDFLLICLWTAKLFSLPFEFVLYIDFIRNVDRLLEFVFLFLVFVPGPVSRSVHHRRLANCMYYT